MENKEKILEVLDAIALDAESDSSSFDYKPFNGHTVGTQLGNIYASIYTLANILKEVIKDEN